MFDSDHLSAPLTVQQLGHDGVKNLVVKKHNLLAIKIVGNIMEQRQGKLNLEYNYMDPKF